MIRKRLAFVTGKLAERSLREVLGQMENKIDFDYDVFSMPISVAALATTDWIASHIKLSQKYDRIVIPGLCRGELDSIQDKFSTDVVRGPKDLQDLPEFFAIDQEKKSNFGKHDIELIYEINHAPSLTLQELHKQANDAICQHADIIDLGCNPGETWHAAGDAVRLLKSEGYRVSIDSFNPKEIELAVAAGVDLVLSVNSSNRHLAKDWMVEVVAIPDTPDNLDSLQETVSFLNDANVPHRIDPILEPIGFGFAASLQRYWQARQLFPNVEIMMGIGNLTEMTEVDSAGVNMLLLAICQELGIRSVLTTSVINWCQSVLLELHTARKLSYYAVNHNVVPKHLDSGLVMLRDAKLKYKDRNELRRLADQIKDKNYRIFVSGNEVYLFNHRCFLHAKNPYELLAMLMQTDPEITADHTFYLGYEISKAFTALTLGKNYVQDQSLSWGILTVPEPPWNPTRN